MYKKVQKLLVIFLSIAVGFSLLGSVALAQNDKSTYKAQQLPFDPNEAAQLDDKGYKASVLTLTSPVLIIDLGSRDPFTLTISIINLVLTLLASAFLILLIYAGFLWVSAQGNQEAIEKSKSLIKQSMIGLAIILGSFGIASLIFTQLEQRFNPESETTSEQG